MAWDEHGDVVVIVPGITGSVLRRDGRDILGLSVGAGLRALWSVGGSLQTMALAGDPPDVADLGDGVTADRLAPDAHLIPGLWKIDGYRRITDWLSQRLRLERGIDLFEFPYDWRRDNRVAATLLRDHACRWLHERRKSFPQARLVLLTHSMGGLVARYYLEVLRGWSETRRLITIGTPHRGSLNVLNFLVNGYEKAFGLVDITDLMRSFTSVHQLLPIYPCIRIDGAAPARLTELTQPLQGLDPAKVRAADVFHREIESAVTRNRDDAAYRERGYTMNEVIGSEHPTRQSADWASGRLTFHREWDGQDMGGDGTVPRVSATAIEHSADGSEWFAGTRHSSLQNADAVLLQIRRSLVTPSLNLAQFRAMAPVTISVDLADVYPPGEPPTVRVRPSDVGPVLHLERI
ncbi:lipase/acyltransferase domain-containing protein [Couchioplanes caeruleus]|uniref:Lecithin:cholesterol acyltransferase n=2 Tax=Couchioplanes caeruleus TaxID=56438 RepID=A0A1K0GQC6_9ACTN|nr:hypothetical protein [Couchioplanes caeruleus]OJF11467.1 hypothetical protein BG844_26135 [Couchioplanes caeruleus subsp. caeruleus]OJF15890.1 hypothetical protein BG844_01225 [Couchioplanes caeruleus subsp. caeruleus]ROP33548.1 lecithin:cholesterol acyltransferase [Couchioplanes caeruleus]